MPAASEHVIGQQIAKCNSSSPLGTRRECLLGGGEGGGRPGGGGDGGGGLGGGGPETASRFHAYLSSSPHCVVEKGGQMSTAKKSCYAR